MVSTEIDARLSALERAVAELRHLVGDKAPTSSHRAPPDDRLWVLEGLEQRVPDGAVVYAGSVNPPGGGVVRWQYGLPASEIFEQEWEEHAQRLAALGHPVRLQIMRAVLHGTTSASRLVEEVGAGTSGQVYHHLKELTAAGWLTSPRRGAFTMPASQVVPLLAVLVAAGTP